MGYFTNNGYQIQTSQEIINDINAIFVAVFGSSVNLSPSSPNGLFIQQLANRAIQNQNFMVLLTSSLYNPDVASSVWLDMICKLSGINRAQATKSTVTCTCYGSAGTVIPAGTQISSTSGAIFTNLSAGTIGNTGSIEIIFTALSSGPIACAAGTVNNIINKIYGWDSVTNSTDGEVGGTAESDNDLRERRSNLLASYGSAALGAIYAGVYAVNGVTDVFVLENDTSGSITSSGVSLVPNSIYVAAIGGSDANVAKALYQKKCPGVNMNGNTTYKLTNSYGGTWTARFQRPVQVPLQIDISLKNMTSYPTDIVTQVQNAIVNNFNGIDSNVPQMTAIKINQIINVSRFVPSLIAIGAWDILTFTIQTLSGGSPASYIKLVPE